MKVKSESEVTESCPTLSDPMDCSPPGSSIRGIFQARVLEWGAIDCVDHNKLWKILRKKGLGLLDLLWEKVMAPHSSTLAWKIPWMEEPGGLQSMGL